MTFARLRTADWAVFLAALALLFVTAADWYSTKGGEQAREVERGAPTRGEPEIAADAAATAESEERNAWQAGGAIDRLILVGLLGTTALAVCAAFMRAAARRYPERLSPTAWTGLAAALTAVLVLYRVIQEPGDDAITTVQLGAPLALAVLGLIALACAASLRAEEQGRELREVEQAPARP